MIVPGFFPESVFNSDRKVRIRSGPSFLLRLRKRPRRSWSKTRWWGQQSKRIPREIPEDPEKYQNHNIRADDDGLSRPFILKNQQNDKKQGRQIDGIVTQNSSQIAMKQAISRPCRTAAGTIQMQQFMEWTRRKKTLPAGIISIKEK